MRAMAWSKQVRVGRRFTAHYGGQSVGRVITDDWCRKGGCGCRWRDVMSASYLQVLFNPVHLTAECVHNGFPVLQHERLHVLDVAHGVHLLPDKVDPISVTFVMLRNTWRAKQIKINTKLRIFHSNVKAVLLYGSETWQSTQKTLKRIQTFINKCLRRILHMKWTDKAPNITLWKMTKRLPIENEIKKRK